MLSSTISTRFGRDRDAALVVLAFACLEFGGGVGEGGEGHFGEWVSVAGWEQGVDVALWCGAVDRAKCGVFEGVGEQLGGERDGESAGDEGADGELVAGDGNQARFKAGGAAGAHDDSVGRGGGPVVVGEVDEADAWLAGEPVLWRKGDEELFAKEVVAFESVVLVGCPGGVLEADGEVQLAGPYAGGEFVGGAFDDAHPRAGVVFAQTLQRGRDEPGERAWDGADAEAGVVVVQDLGELSLGEGEALGDDIGVREQRLAGAREAQPARPPLEQLAAELALEQGDLM